MDAAAAATLMTSSADSRLKQAATTGFYRLGKPKQMTEAQVDATAKDFESMFISQMLSQMFNDSVGETMGDDLFGSEDTKEIYKTLMVDEYGKMISKAGGIGIASYVKKELLALQEVAS